MTISAAIDKLSLKTKIFYGIGDIGNAIFNTAVSFFLLVFYTDGAMIAPALASSALLIGKIWDAVNDPIFGAISDRAHHKLGKRRVFMIYGAAPLAVFAALLWIVPAGMTDVLTFLWIAMTFILFDTFMTITGVPYYALTAELTRDYDERSSLTTWRMLFGVIAFAIGASGTPFFVSLFKDLRTGYMIVGAIYGVICAAVLWISASGLHERQDICEQSVETPPWKAFWTTLKNKKFLQLIVAYLIASLGFTLIQTLLVYYLKYQLNMPKDITLVTAILLLSVLIFLFPWRWISQKMNKGPAFAIGLGIAGLAMLSSFLLPHKPTPFIYLVAFIAGAGFSANWVFPWSMVPDVVEFDELECGETRSGMFYGVWGFTSKLTAALAIATSGWVLQLSGYVANAEQTPVTLNAIKLFFGVVPAVMFAIAFPLLFLYPITQKSHAEALKKLQEKKANSKRIAK
jgi:glycoside/pentoside/hexuronide:cation symporter, GPH family